MTTLEDFYYGNIIPHEIPIIKGSEYDTANRLVVRHDEALTATLTEQQKPFLEQDEMVEITGLEETCRQFHKACKITENDGFMRIIGTFRVTAITFHPTRITPKMT